MEGPCGAHRTQVGCAEGGCRNPEPPGALLEVAEIVWTGRGPGTRARAELPNLGVPPGAAVSRSNPAALHPPFASALCVLLLFTFAFSSAFFPPFPCPSPARLSSLPQQEHGRAPWGPWWQCGDKVGSRWCWGAAASSLLPDRCGVNSPGCSGDASEDPSSSAAVQPTDAISELRFPRYRGSRLPRWLGTPLSAPSRWQGGDKGHPVGSRRCRAGQPIPLCPSPCPCSPWGAASPVPTALPGRVVAEPACGGRSRGMQLA